MGVPEHIRSRNSAEIELESGLKLGLTLPNARDFIHSGDLAWPLLERMAELEKKDGESAELTDEERQTLYAFQRRMVAKTITSVEGEVVELDPDDLDWLSDAEFFEVVQYFMRSKALPGKA